MAGIVPNDVRDTAQSLFRQRILQKMEVVPFAHQAAWWAAADGYMLLPEVHDPDGMEVRVPNDLNDPSKGDRIERWAIIPRDGGRARVLALLAAFKGGKSFSAGLFGAGFAAVPGARIQIVGMEYDICGPEFDYIAEALLSERGMGLKYDSMQNRPRDGKMWIDLPNGARFEARSWERRESLKGKEVDLYIFAEAYQFPGIEAYTSNSQNLRVRKGYAVFPTTPDRPWLQELHNRSHSGQSEFGDWHCTCGIGAEQNPISYDPVARIRDEQIMTREKFAIHYEGKLGDFVGRVFSYQRGQLHFTPGSHPELFREDFDPRKSATLADLRIPAGWSIVVGGDTGTFYSALIVAFSPDGEAFVLAEFPNYRYVASSPERDEGVTIPEWSREVKKVIYALSGRPDIWVDTNSQFKKELENYGISLMGNKMPVETRTEITREYFQHGRIRLAPWLSVLPFELENAKWPEEASAAGKFARVKDRDHTLDGLEHVLSRRPMGREAAAPPKKTWLEEQFGVQSRRPGNVHMGEM